MKPVPPTSVSIMVQVFRVVFSSMPIRDFTSQGVQNNQYQRNHNNAYNRSKGRQLRLIKICLICYMLRNRNVIFFPAESAKHRACHNHGNRTAQNTGIAMTRPVIPRAQTAFSSPNFFTIVTAILWAPPEVSSIAPNMEPRPTSLVGFNAVSICVPLSLFVFPFSPSAGQLPFIRIRRTVFKSLIIYCNSSAMVLLAAYSGQEAPGG